MAIQSNAAGIIIIIIIAIERLDECQRRALPAANCYSAPSLALNDRPLIRAQFHARKDRDFAKLFIRPSRVVYYLFVLSLDSLGSLHRHHHDDDDQSAESIGQVWPQPQPFSAHAEEPPAWPAFWGLIPTHRMICWLRGAE